MGPRAGVAAGLLAHGEQRQLKVAVALACGPAHAFARRAHG